ncbi:MAG: ferrochelatase [Parvularculales bacterium]
MSAQLSKKGEKERWAVVLLNLGGPDSLKSVRPFLFNLFRDRAIIRAPTLVRLPLAWLISTRRAPVARAIYEEIGGRSPILKETQAQAQSLESHITEEVNNVKIRAFIAMRYWHPRAYETAQAVAAFKPDRLIVLPLYPHYSTTTTESSLQDWNKAAYSAGLNIPTHDIHIVCCYPEEPDFIIAHAELIVPHLAVSPESNTRLLFSAHGLPERIVAAGDPYPHQMRKTCESVIKALRSLRAGSPDPEWKLCYQSRVGPLAWIGPYTEDEIIRASNEKKNIVIAPISFVSEHSETLVELDIEYKHLADAHGAASYRRVPALGTNPAFIKALGSLVRRAVKKEGLMCPEDTPGFPCAADALQAVL